VSHGFRPTSAISDCLLFSCQNNFMDTDFDSVWLSSREHLERFHAIREATPWYRALLGGRYRIPPEFPSIQIGSQNYPLVYFSSGDLTIRNNIIAYEPRPSGAGLVHNRNNINSSIAFSIDIAQHPRFERFRARGSSSYFSITWIELSLPTRSFLLCAGAPGPGMSGVNERTDALYKAINSWGDDKS
jgi:hypothetical protein